MTTLQELCSQLMKPAKDLAEWNFPLAQILEDYYTLMHEPCNLNFSEAALILQNSANVYVRRVEYLYQDTAALSKSMQENEDEASQFVERKNTENSNRRSRKTIIDFKNFDLVDFSVGILKKNHERENPKKEERKIKLISPRFPQLENISRHKFSQEIIDIAGEVIGKKYDFRCNQQLTISKMLIEEVTPADFDIKKPDNRHTSDVSMERVNCDDHLDLYSDDNMAIDETILNQTQESGYESLASTSQLNISDSQITSDFSPSLNNTLQDVDDPIMSSITDASIESDESRNDSGLDQSKTSNDENNESDSVESGEQSSENNSSVDFERHSKNNSERSSLNNFDKTEHENSLYNKSTVTEKPLNTRDSTETDAGYTSADPDDLQMSSTPKKSNQTIEESINSWEPISVESVVPDKIPKRRKEFKLPCHIALLKSVPNLRKRTRAESAKKRYSKKKAKNTAEADEIKEMFKEFLKIRPKLNSQNYEPVLNENMECLGYQSKLELLETPTENLSKSESVHSTRLKTVSSPLLLSESPYVFLDHLQDDEYSDGSDNSGFQTVGLSHQKRIERKMKELKKNFDITHDREEESTKWFETVEALKAVENRPSFHVNEYEKRIIESLKAKNEHQVEFHEIAEQEEPGNIARLFVASLHLANTYNVEINVVNKEDNSELNLKLLDAEFNPTT